MSRIDDIEARASFARVSLADRSIAIPREIEAARVSLRDIPDLVAFARDVAAELADADDWDGLNADAVQRMQGYLERLDGGA